MYEPIHGSAPDIAGQNIANPLATILSAAMMLRYTLDQPEMADRIEQAVSKVLDQGLRTADIYSEGMTKVSTSEMGDAVVAAL
jgi:3-isopropylmalate dehydrogenase